jgi:uncharacterized membrane protein
MLTAEMSGFWEGFFLLLIWIPLVMIWVFVLMDLFRRDMSGWLKAMWIIAIVLLPFFGAILYLIFRPLSDIEMEQGYKEEMEFQQASHTADKLAKLSDLLDKGRISQEEFDKQKAKLMKQ